MKEFFEELLGSEGRFDEIKQGMAMQLGAAMNDALSELLHRMRAGFLARMAFNQLIVDFELQKSIGVNIQMMAGVF